MHRFRFVEANETELNDTIEQMAPDYIVGAWDYLEGRDEFLILFVQQPQIPGGLDDLGALFG